MTNTPGWTTPGPSDSPEPDDGTGPDTSATHEEPTVGQNFESPAPAENTVPAQAARPGWSHRQPPPNANGWARWTPPPGVQAPKPPEQGGPRWGGPPTLNGWQQQGPWSRPAAPKPGVIPLRPLNVGEILDGSIATLRLHWRAIVGVTFAVGVVTQAIAVAVQGLFTDDSSIKKIENDSHPSAHDVLHALRDAYAGLGVTIVVAALGVLAATAMLTMVTSRAVLGRSVNVGEAWREARPRMGRLIGLSFLLVFLYVAVLAVAIVPGILVAAAGSTGGGAALAVLGACAGLVVMVWLWILLSLSPPALMLEDQSIVGAMKRSAKLVRGAWWRVLGVELLTAVLTYIASAIIELPFTLVSAAFTNDSFASFYSSDSNPSWTFLVVSGIGAVVASTFTLPISAGTVTLLYVDQRIRRESLDIELTQAAAKN
ncbi:hypothetical protein SAMN05216223_1113 [Actinacidiphila yanglinensis]|uniref:DUF7847 domain-containing protein n=1 Tax=Actinacidiphila yanglinensis TaxID=310779 RepID=A0A1H6CYX5_9ACTN|nr:hypothetical protein [Actinacidiphila yanglinensis]SEG78339.1 hypothetical protein SAMN05216223_1113 [Actinacidiphila yanglinensis]